MLLEMVKTTILMVLKAGTDDPRLSYAGAIMGRGRGHLLTRSKVQFLSPAPYMDRYPSGKGAGLLNR